MVSEQYKGFDVLIKAVAILHKEKVDVSLHVVSDDRESDDIEKLEDNYVRV